MKNLMIFLIVATVAITGCKKDLKTDAPTTDISLTNMRSTIGDTLVFKLGDTCKFTLNGYSDNITYWSGATNNKFEFNDRSAALGKILLSFNSTASFGTQTNTVTVFASNKLPARDSVSVVDHNWVDITPRLNLATSATSVFSGNVDLTDLISNEKDSLFVAFRYVGTTGTTQRTWVISNFAVKNVGADFNATLASNAMDPTVNSWTRFGNVPTPANAMWVPSASQLQIIGGGGVAPSNTSWIVTKTIYVGRITPDVPTATVKNITASASTSYNFKYPAVGSYTATFVSANNTVGENKEKIQKFNIKIIN